MLPNMETDPKYTLVGGFVIAAMMLIVCAVLWLSNHGVKADYKWYLIRFRHHSLNGLQLNSAVTMKGIKVGSVEKLGISTKNIELVQVLLKVEKDTPVKVDTKAVVNRNLLTGLALIDLREGTQDSLPLVDPAPGEDYPVIPEGRSELDAVASSLPDLANDATEVLSHAKQLFSDANIESFSNSLKNAEKFSEMLAKNSDTIDDLLSNTNELVSDLDRTSANLAKFTRPGDGELAKVTQGLQTGVEELKNLIKNLNDRATQLASDLSNTFRVVTQDINTAATSVAQASRSFSSTAEYLGDLRTLVGGPDESSLGPGEKREE